MLCTCLCVLESAPVTTDDLWRVYVCGKAGVMVFSAQDGRADGKEWKLGRPCAGCSEDSQNRAQASCQCMQQAGLFRSGQMHVCECASVVRVAGQHRARVVQTDSWPQARRFGLQAGSFLLVCALVAVCADEACQG